jgi:hypothetical protein
MSAEDTLTLEEHIFRFRGKQLAWYIWGIVVFILGLASVYYGLTSQLTELKNEATTARSDNAKLRLDMKDLSNKFDQSQQQSEIRYLEIKLELAKKQDKR